MNYIFVSNFKNFIEGLLAEKYALGRKYADPEMDLRRFDMFCYEKFPTETILKQEIVMDWTIRRSDESMSRLAKRATAVRQLAKYMWRQGTPAYILPDGFTGKREQYNPHIYTKQELAALFHVMDHCKPCKKYPFYHYVVPVFFRLIYTCGLRPGEALVIKADDVNLQSGEILIREAKGHKDRVVVLSSDMLNLFRNYYAKMRLFYPRAEVFFPNYLSKPYSFVWIEKTFQKMWRKTGIDGPRPRIYDLRHTFATECLYRFVSEGKDLTAWLPYLSSYMGHLDYDSTAYYIHLVPAYFPVMKKGSDVFNEIIPEVRHEVY